VRLTIRGSTGTTDAAVLDVGASAKAGAGLLSGVDHVAVVVADIEQALASFEKFGFRVASDESLAQPPVRLVHLDAGNVDLQLVQPLGPSGLADDLRERGPGLHHVCFGVPGLAESLADLEEPDEAAFTGGQGRRACFLSSRPSQLQIELIEFRDGAAYGTLTTATDRVVAYWVDECRRDLDRLLTHFSEDAEVITPDGRYAGKSAIVELYQASFDAYPGLEVDVTARFAGRGTHAFEYRATLTDTQSDRWLVEGVNVMTLENGLIASLRSYEDAPRRERA
jgi:methylmalonyl-CoA/ethylmalonyl-CoA epimerase